MFPTKVQFCYWNLAPLSPSKLIPVFPPFIVIKIIFTCTAVALILSISYNRLVLLPHCFHFRSSQKIHRHFFSTISITLIKLPLWFCSPSLKSILRAVLMGCFYVSRWTTSLRDRCVIIHVLKFSFFQSHSSR